MAHNARPHESTNISLYELLFGRRARIFPSAKRQRGQLQKPDEASTDDELLWMQADVADRLEKAKAKQKTEYDGRHGPRRQAALRHSIQFVQSGIALKSSSEHAKPKVPAANFRRNLAFW
ncbi:hypothetical protein V8E36_005937 [Tilletia maclaganii]